MLSAGIVCLLAVLLPQGAARFVRFEHGVGSESEPVVDAELEPVVADDVEPEPVVADKSESEPVVTDHEEKSARAALESDKATLQSDLDADEGSTADDSEDSDDEDDSGEFRFIDFDSATEEQKLVVEAEGRRRWEINSAVATRADHDPYDPELKLEWAAELRKRKEFKLMWRNKFGQGAPEELDAPPEDRPEEPAEAEPAKDGKDAAEESTEDTKDGKDRPEEPEPVEAEPAVAEEPESTASTPPLPKQSKKIRPGPYYVFLETWNLKGVIAGAVGGVHTELLFCDKKLFTKEAVEYLREYSYQAEIKKTWWITQTVKCTAMYFRAFDADYIYSHKPGSGQVVYTRYLESSSSDLPEADQQTVKKFFYSTTKMNVKQLKFRMNDCSDQWRAIDYGSRKRKIHNYDNYHTAVALQCDLKKKLSGYGAPKLPFGPLLSAGQCKAMCKDREPSEEQVRGLERALWMNMKREGKYREVSAARYERCPAGTQIHTFKGGSMRDKCKSLSHLDEPRACDDGSTIYCPNENTHTRCCCPDSALSVSKKMFGKKRKTCVKAIPVRATSPDVSSDSPKFKNLWSENFNWGKQGEDDDEDEDDVRDTHREIARSNPGSNRPDAAAGLLVALVLGLVQ